jgi:hypothetical protein
MVLVSILLGIVLKIILGGDIPNKYVASMHPYGPSVAPTKP